MDTVREVTDSLSVRELCDVVSAAVSGAFSTEVWVRGTISGLKRHSSGTVYFDLVDDSDELGSATAAVMSVALFEKDKMRVNNILKKVAASGVRMADGMEILIRGAVRYYPRSGRVQLKMSLIDPSYTVGKMEIAKALLLAELKAEGLLQSNKVLPLNLVPLNIALVTSANSAAEADFVNEVVSSGFPFRIHLFDTRVQGDGAVGSLTSSMRAISQSTELIDVVAIVRGGGARADLVAFDHGDVARAIARCHVPVIIGVGHDIDRSVCDEVAHTTTKTPTACASHIVSHVDRFVSRIDNASQRLAHLGRMHLKVEHNRLDSIAARITASPSNVFTRETHRLDNARVRARALDPALALARGWSITRTADGSPVRSAADISPGTEVITILSDGQIRSTVSTVELDRGPLDDSENIGEVLT